MNYTPEEIEQAVEALVLSSIKTERDSLGARDFKSTFSQTQEAAAGVFLLYFNAPFYVAYLGSRRLLEIVVTTTELAELVLDAITATGRTTFKVEDLTPLANAQVALGELSSAISARTQGFKDIEAVPAWRRYAQNVDTFIEANGRNIKKGGQIVQTPDQARAQLPGLLTALSEAMALLREKAAQLANALVDFDLLNLPSVAAAGVIQRAREKLDSRYDELSSLDDAGRLEVLRDVNLDLLAQKAIVKKYGAAQKPTPYHSVKGSVSAFADATHPASPASFVGEVAGPFSITESNNTLTITMDGGAPKSLQLPLSPVAELHGIVFEPFLIDSTNDQIEIEVTDINGIVGNAVIDLVNGTRSAQQIVSDMFAALDALDVNVRRAFQVSKYESLMNISISAPNVARFDLLNGTLNDFGVKLGDQADVLGGANDGTTWNITSLHVSGTWFEATLDPTPADPTPEAGQLVRLGAAARVIDIRDNIGDEISIAARRKIRFVADGNGRHDYGARAIGFAPELYAQSAPTLARDVVDAINGSLATPRATVRLDGMGVGFGRTNLEDPVLVTLYEGRGTASVNGAIVNQMTFTNLVLEQGAIPSPGDKVVLRSGNNVGKVGSVTAATSTSFTASITGSVSSGAGILFESGPGTFFEYGSVFEVLTGPNRGAYVVLSDQGDIPFDIEIQTALPVLKNGDLPVFFEAQLAQEYMNLDSLDTSLATSIAISGPAGYFFSSLVPDQVAGRTHYWQLTELPKAALPGDVIETYLTNYRQATEVYPITEIDASLRVVRTSNNVATSFTALMSDGQGPPPFARLRVGEVASYSQFKARLDLWSGLSVAQASYFTNLYRFVNPLLVNKNPTAVAVRDAEREVEELISYLSIAGATSYGATGSQSSLASTVDTIEHILDSYVVSPVGPVDVLLKSFKERGADRAIDILLSGDFSGFFGLDANGVSYSGNLQEAARELAREDLPMRKYDRAGFKGERIISTASEKDYEFDLSDADADVAPDPTPSTG